VPATPDFTVRSLHTADLAAYKALRDHMLQAHPEAFTSDAETESARTAQSYASRLASAAAGPGHFTLAALLSDRLVGAISCEREPRAKVRHVGHLVGMMVRSEARGLGIGRALLHECIVQARGSGIELLTLSVTAGNAPAVALYLQAGFSRYGALPRAIKIDGRYLDKDLMLLAL
jgi:ribosomal protein S18 acetylase RimI-like enzyme